MRWSLAAPAALLIALAGCGGGGKNDTASSTASTTAQATQTTKVEVVRPADDGGARPKFDPETIYKTLSPGVVTIISLSGASSNVSGRQSQSLGSGFVVDPKGYVATNAHVVTSDSGARAKDVYATFSDGNQLAAKIVGVDPDSDVALLKVDPSLLRGPGAKVVPLPWGATSGLQVGDPVAAIGSPFGEQQSLSVGVVSALNRNIESLTAFRIGNAIQTDAAINHGNSGGPLLSGDGRVIGINSQISSTSGGGEGVGFAIPVETVKRSVDGLRANGKVSYAYLGVSSIPIYPQLAERLGLKVINGSLIDAVEKGGPADKAGLRGAKDHITFQGQRGTPVGSDLIIAVDGRRLTLPDDLADVIGAHTPGDKVNLVVIRDGKRLTIPVKLGTRPAGKAGAH
jgi:S1-C subfamily serine protease